MPAEVYIVLAGGLIGAVPALVVAWWNIRAQKERASGDRKHQEHMVARAEIVKMRIKAGSLLIRAFYDVYMELDPSGMGAIIYSGDQRSFQTNQERIKAVDGKLMLLQDVILKNELALGKQTLLAYYSFKGAFDAIRIHAFGKPLDEYGCHDVMRKLMENASADFSKALADDLETASIETPTIEEIHLVRKPTRASTRHDIEAYMDKIDPSRKRED